MRAFVVRAVVVCALLAFLLPATRALAAGSQVVLSHQRLTPISTAGRRVPSRPPVALRKFRTLDPVALAAGRAAAAREYASSPHARSRQPRTGLFNGLS